MFEYLILMLKFLLECYVLIIFEMVNVQKWGLIALWWTWLDMCNVTILLDLKIFLLMEFGISENYDGVYTG